MRGCGRRTTRSRYWRNGPPKAERPVIIVGDEIVKSDALQEAADFAAALGAPVYQQSTPYGSHFPLRASVLWGRCRGRSRRCATCCSAYDLAVVLGGDPLRMSVHSEVGAAAGGNAAGAGRAGGLGHCQEFSRRDRVKGRCRRDVAGLDPGAGRDGRRGACLTRQGEHRGAFSEELDLRGARSLSPRSPRAATARRSIRTGWRCRRSMRCRRTPSSSMKH